MEKKEYYTQAAKENLIFVSQEVERLLNKKRLSAEDKEKLHELQDVIISHYQEPKVLKALG